MGTVGKKFYSKYSGRKLKSKDLISLIEKNGGPSGLDLSGKDLSRIKLNSKTIEKLRRKKHIYGNTVPVWQCPQTGGINLQGANLSYSVLSNADLSRSCLRGVDLRGAHLENVDLIDADLRDTILWDANLNRAVLDGTDLRGANIFGANISDTTLNKECFGDAIIQESKSYELPPTMKMSTERNRCWQASKIYRTLKAHFDNTSCYRDASWAYRKARRMEKRLAFSYAQTAWRKRNFKGIISQLWKYFTDEISEKLCDYGEKPLLVLWWIVFVWFGFAFVYGVLEGVQYKNTNEIIETTNKFSDWITFSLATMTTLEPIGLSARDVWFMRILMPIEALLGIALTGLFGFVLGNRINRV